MGILCLCQQWSNMFKSLLATALVVAVKAEADPFYGYYGALPYAHGYAVAGVPFGSPSGLDPITQGLDPVTQGALPVAHYYGKRSADAEADPYYLGGYAVAGLPLDTHLARTPSPSALMPPPRDTSLTPTDTLATDTSDTTTARGLLTLRLIPTTSVVTLSPTPPTVLLLPLSPWDPPLAWTPSPRALTPPPRDTLPTPMATLATTTVKFRELTRRVC